MTPPRLRSEFRPDRPYAPVVSSAALHFTEGRSGIRSITICCFRICPPTFAAAGTQRAASSRSGVIRINAMA